MEIITLAFEEFSEQSQRKLHEQLESVEQGITGGVPIG